MPPFYFTPNPSRITWANCKYTNQKRIKFNEFFHKKWGFGGKTKGRYTKFPKTL